MHSNIVAGNPQSVKQAFVVRISQIVEMGKLPEQSACAMTGINWEGDLGKVDTAAKENENQNDTMTKGNMKIELDHSDQTAETGGDISQTVSVARWIVYFQGALLELWPPLFLSLG